MIETNVILGTTPPHFFAIAAVGYDASRKVQTQAALDGIHTLGTLVPAVVLLVKGATNMDNVRMGIVGFGAQGGFYTGFLSEGKVKNMVLGAICDIDPGKKAACAEKYPNVPFFDSYIDKLESGDVDAIVTCVPY